MIRRRIAAVLAAFLLGAAAGAAAQSFKPFVVKDIRAEGLQRTEPGTVFSYLPVKVGETMNEEKAQQALRALYATGFFTDVRLEVENDVLVVYVQERPAIAQIDFSGIKEFENEQLRKALRELGMAEARIFDRSMLDLAEQEIKRQYLSHGYYAAAVQNTVTPLERNRVGINITVTEGEVAKIGGINIVGAQAFPERELVDLFVLRTPGWLTWYTKHDRYAREKLSADLETLRSYYQNRGYLDFNIESTQVSITPDRRQIYITVNVIEGEIYRLGRPAERADAAAQGPAGKAGAAQAGGRVLAREAGRQHQGDQRPARQRGLCIRQHQRHPQRRQGKAQRSVQHRHRPRAAGLRAAHRGRRQHQDPRRGDPQGDAAARRRLLRCLEDPAFPPAHRAHRVLHRGDGRNAPGGDKQRPGRRPVQRKGETHRRAAGRCRVLQRREARFLDIDPAIERLRHRKVHRRDDQQRQRQQGLLAVLSRSVLHDRRRQPGLRCLQAPHRRVQPDGRPLRHRFHRRRREVRLSHLGDHGDRFRGELRIGKSADLRYQPAAIHQFRQPVRQHLPLWRRNRRLDARHARQYPAAQIGCPVAREQRVCGRRPAVLPPGIPA